MMQQSQSESKLAVPVSKVSVLKVSKKGRKNVEFANKAWVALKRHTSKIQTSH